MKTQRISRELTLDELELLENLCGRIERAESAEDRNIENLVDGTEGELRTYFIRELLWQAIELRQVNGERPSISDYTFASELDNQIAIEVFEDFEQDQAFVNLCHDSKSSKNSGLPERYQKIEQIGRGGIGAIWRVNDRQSQRPLAIKTLRPKFRGDRQANLRLEREAILTGMLQHPGIPPVHDHGVLNDLSIFFVMKLIDGQTLGEILAEDNEDDPERSKQQTAVNAFALNVFEKVAQTMAYAHSQNVIHRDLKPENIMVGQFAEVQVMDWGMAKRLASASQTSNLESSLFAHRPGEKNFNAQSHRRDDPSKTIEQVIETVGIGGESSVNVKNELTQMGDVLGTPSYMSPEQARGELNQLNARSDVYSLGAILFEILTRERIHEGHSTAEVFEKVTTGALGDSLSKLESCQADEKLIDLCRRCLAFRPKYRPEHAGVIAKELGEHFTNTQQRIKAAEIELREAEVRVNEEAKRRKTFSRMLMLVASVFAIGLAGVTWQWINAKVAGDLAAKNANNYKQGLTVFTGAFKAVKPESGSDVSMSAKDVLLEAKECLANSSMDDVGRMAMLRELTDCFRAIGEFDPAVATAEDSLTLHLDYYGERDAEVLHAMHDLGVAYLKVGRLDEALPLHKEALELNKELLGENHENTLTAMMSLAEVYSDLGKSDDALTLYEEAFERQQALFGIEHINTLASISSLAEGYRDAGRLDEALALSETALEQKKKIHGKDHPTTLTAMNNLAIAYGDLGRIDESIALTEETFELKMIKLGEDHPDTLTTMGNLGMLYDKAGRFDDSLPINEKVLAVRLVKLGDDHPQTFLSMNNLALTYKSLGRLEEALEIQEKTLKLQRAKFDEDHPWNLILMGSIGFSYSSLDRLDDALEIHLKALELKKNKLGVEHPLTLNSMNNVAFTYKELDRLKEATQLFEASLELHRTVYGDEGSKTLSTMNSLGEAYLIGQRFEEAEPLLKTCLGKRKKQEPDVWRTYFTQSLYGEVLLKLGLEDEAAEHLTAGYDGLKSVEESIPTGARISRLTRALEYLVELAEARERPTEIAKWTTELEVLVAEEEN